MPQTFRKYHKQLHERGFASIVIALVLIIVIALLTIGFAELARHEQQSALNKQLAAQANYAAESGVNDAYKDIVSGKINTSNAQSTNCMKAGAGPSNLPPDALTANQQVDTGHGVSYTCLLVNLNTSDLLFNNVSPDNGQHATFSTSTPLNSMTVTWGSASGQNSFPVNTATKFPSQSAWHDASNHPYAPVIEFSVTGLPATFNRDTLINNTFTVYLYPASSGGATSCAGVSYHSCVVVSSGSAAQGQLVSGNCDNTPATSYPCSVTLTAGAPGVYSQYLIHFRSFYTNNPPNIRVTGAGPSGAVTFTGEPQIDVTGKARNVLKRLQVRFLTNGATGGPDDTDILPSSAIESQNLCKRLQTAPTTADNPLGTTFNPSSGPCDLEQYSAP